MILFTDVETTNLLFNDIPRYDTRQPHIVQWASMLTDNDGVERAFYNFLIKPDGWTIPAEATECHGITLAECETYGIDIRMPTSMFSHMCHMADEIVIYNLGYDDEVIKCEYLRQGRDHYMYPEKLKCCMKPCTDICQLPNPRGYSGYKFAKLTEAHKHFFGMPQADAHDAGADVRATRDVWLKLREIKRV